MANRSRPTAPVSQNAEYLLWAGAVVGVLVAIGQLAAERADRKHKDSRFNWIEVD